MKTSKLMRQHEPDHNIIITSHFLIHSEFFFLDCLNFLRSLSLSIREVCSFQHTGMQKSILFDDDHKEVVVEKRVKE